MIGLKELTAGIAEYLTAQIGVPAFAGRAENPVYPWLTVEAKSKSAGIIACGRQVERQVTVTVTCYPSRRRDREAGLELADRVYDTVMPGFSVCGRGFCPREAEVWADEQERCRVEFLLEFCDLPGKKQSTGSTATETMGSLAIRVSQQKEES